MSEKYIAVVDISFKPESDAVHHEETTGFKIIKQFTELGVPCIAFSSHDSGGFIRTAKPSSTKALPSNGSFYRTSSKLH
jgi:two-component system uhpT operon response regulator UhpA